MIKSLFEMFTCDTVTGSDSYCVILSLCDKVTV